MRYIPRLMEPALLRAARRFPALLLTGPRRAGKTTMLRALFPRASYRLLEDPDLVARFRADPRGFLDELEPPVILDEIQNVPEILAYLRSRIDAEPRKKGRWLLTGSQEAPLMRGVTESLAGRAAVFHLLPLSVLEYGRTSILRGGFPEALARPADAPLWFASYVQTYLERDVRAVTGIRDLPTFRRFLGLVAGRSGQFLNRTDLAAPLGVSVPTISGWLNVLEATCQIIVVPPYFENFGKRLIKSPKIYLADAGLACHLLGIGSEDELTRSPFLGALFEGWVASEIVKRQANAGLRRELYCFRDHQGLEVDFLIPAGARRVVLVEAKASRTVTPDMAGPMRRLSAAMSGYAIECCVVHREPRTAAGSHVTAPGVRAFTLPEFMRHLDSRTRTGGG